MAQLLLIALYQPRPLAEGEVEKEQFKHNAQAEPHRGVGPETVEISTANFVQQRPRRSHNQHANRADQKQTSVRNFGPDNQSKNNQQQAVGQ